MRISSVYFVLLIDLFVEAVVHQAYHPTCPGINIKNGKVVRRRQRGRFVKFMCNTGYLLAGERHSTCVRREWDPPPPKCVRATCMNKVLPPTNGLIYPSHNGAALHFFCRSGFTLRGPSDVFCDGRQWDNNAPTCIAENETPKLFCDFEDDDICGWTPDLNHDFDWRRESYNTPSGSIGTGPSFDHTLGVGKGGHYMYIESSSRNINDTARLISPIFDKMDAEVCLEFFYHMFGATIGTLRVYIKKESNNWNLYPENARFSKSGNQGDRWYRSFQTLGYMNEEFQIVIEGVRGSGYVSDIAVDDIKIIPNCTGEPDYSTSEISVTDVFPTIDSCENRCGEIEGILNDTYHLTCDCDEDCYDNNRCCPDFFDYCATVSSVGEDDTTTDISNDINLNEIKTQTEFPQTPNMTESILVDRSTVNKSILRTVPTTVRPTTRKILPITTSTTMRPLINSNTFTTKKIPKIIPKYTRPIIYIQTPPSTPEIIWKFIPEQTTPKVKFHIFKPTKPNKEVEIDDVMEVTIPKDNDEALFLTSPLPENDYSKEFWSDELENNIDSPHIRNFSETNKLLSDRAVENPKYNVMLIIVSVTGLTVLVTIGIIVVIVKRYRRIGRRRIFSNGDSQSDVRFLAGEDILDFSLDNEVYGEL